MGRSFTVRRYRAADAAAVWRVHERALEASPIPFLDGAPGDEPLRDVSAHYLEDGGEFLVGVLGDEVVATGGYQPADDRTVEIRHVRVHPDHQRRGYGRRVLAELEARAAEAAYDRAVLFTNVRLRAARRLYEASGYEATGRERDEETGHALVHYRKSL